MELVDFECPICGFPWLERSVSESAGSVLACCGCVSILEPADLLERAGP